MNKVICKFAASFPIEILFNGLRKFRGDGGKKSKNRSPLINKWKT